MGTYTDPMDDAVRVVGAAAKAHAEILVAGVHVRPVQLATCLCAIAPRQECLENKKNVAEDLFC